MVEMTMGYCVKCREKVEMTDEEDIVMRNGKKAIKGKCTNCGTELFRIKHAKKPDYW